MSTTHETPAGVAWIAGLDAAVARRHRSAWPFGLDLRPYKERLLSALAGRRHR